MNLKAFKKYDGERGKINGRGFCFNTILFLGVFLIKFGLSMVAGVDRVHFSVLIYPLIVLISAVVAFFLKNKPFFKIDWLILWQYIFGGIFVCHLQFLRGGFATSFEFFILVFSVSVIYLVQPIYVLAGQASLMVAFFLSYYLSNNGHIGYYETLVLLSTSFIGTLAGTLIWYARMEKIAFTNELVTIATGSDDRFIKGKEESFYERQGKYAYSEECNSTIRKTFTIVFNLTKDKLESVRENNVFDLHTSMDWDEFRMRVLRCAADPITYRSVNEFLSYENISSADVGTRKTIVGYFNFSDKDRMWLEFEVSLSPHPVSAEMMGTIIIEDITNSRILASVLNKLISNEYNFVAVIERGKNSFVSYESLNGEELISHTLGEYEEEFLKYTNLRIADYDLDRVRRLGQLKNVCEELREKSLFIFEADEVRESGEIRKKRYCYSYLDASKRYIVIEKQDITEEFNKNVEIRTTMENAIRQAEAANSIKTEFLTRMSHEMRTPMNAIVGITSLIEDEAGESETIKNYIGIIRKSSEYLLSLINDVLDMSIIEEKKIEIKNSDLNLRELTVTIDDLIEPMCETKGITYIHKTDISDKTIVSADGLRISQVLINLLENAVKYTGAGGQVEFSSYCIGEDSEKGQYRFVIKDTGVGMTEEFANHLFEPFTQDNDANQQNLNGMGLGLTIAKGIIDILGGKITVNSKKDVGTVFVVDLELDKAIGGVPKDKLLNVDVDKLNGKRILVVEDNDINREIAVAVLERKGVICDTAQDGEEAVNKYSASPIYFYDAILMDIKMPKLNGLDATKAIRNTLRGDAKSIPIVAMTANAFADDVSLSVHSGMDAHLSKPIIPKDLYETLMRTIILSEYKK